MNQRKGERGNNMITQWFKTFWDFISNIFSMLVHAITMVIAGVSGMQVIITYMPAVIGSAALVSIAILVVRFICLK